MYEVERCTNKNKIHLKALKYHINKIKSLMLFEVTIPDVRLRIFGNWDNFYWDYLPQLANSIVITENNYLFKM